MSEENKEVSKEEGKPAEQAPSKAQTPPTPAEAPATDTVTAASQVEDKVTASAPAAEPVEKKEAAKKEKPSNCVGCKKSIKKKRWYYRNGKYYCTKRCWAAAVKKADSKVDAPAAA